MFERYKIKTGDNLINIAKNYNTTIEYLKNINDFYFNDKLREGMDIIVPANDELYYTTTKIKNGEKIENVAKSLNLNPNLLATMNGLNQDDYIYKNQEIIIPKINYSYYITKTGDTIDSVSDIFNISKDRLLSQNKTIYLLDSQIMVNKKIK